ncbi:MAG: RibD family protein, partial [Deferribacterales bacterium]
DSNLKIDVNSNIVKDMGRYLVVATTHNDEEKIEQLSKYGVRVIICNKKDNMVDLNDLLDKLAKVNILNILVEGGGKVFASLLKEQLVDKIYIFTANKIIGGDGISIFDSLNVKKVSDAYHCRLVDTKRFEDDTLNIYKLTDYKKSILDLTEKYRNRCKFKCSQE